MNNNTKDNSCIIHPNDIWLADLPQKKDSRVQYGTRPVVVVSNEMANRFSPVITVVPLTTNLQKKMIPAHVYLSSRGLREPSVALCEQVTTVDKSQLIRYLGRVDKPFEALSLRHGLSVQLGLAT